MQERLQRNEEQEEEGEVLRPLFLDLMHHESESVVRNRDLHGGQEGYEDEGEKKLELTLGLSGGEFPRSSSSKEEKPSSNPFPLTLQFPFNSSGSHSAGAKRGFSSTLHSHFQVHRHQPIGVFEGAKLEEKNLGSPEKEEPFSKHGFSTGCCCAAVDDNSSSIRSGTSYMVGWPPIRSSRKNLTSISSKPPSSANSHHSNLGLVEKQEEPEPIARSKSMLVKVNLEGYPIGRKVDLMDFCDYEGLTATVQQLFKGLISAQKDHSVSGNHDEFIRSPGVPGMLDGAGEYILVYEDGEGDRMLAGDVPWNMFLSTAKRLRVLKSSDLPSLSLGISGNGKRTQMVVPI